MKKIITLLMLAFLLLPRPAFAGDLTKTIIVSLNIKNNTFAEISKEIVYAHPPDLGFQQGHFSARLISTGGSLLGEFGVWDPRVQVGDDIVMYENGTLGRISGKVVRADEAGLSIAMPFSRDTGSLEIRDRETGIKMISVELGALVSGFCDAHKDDPDCGAPNYAVVVIAAAIIAAIVIIAIVLGLALKSQRRGKKK